MEFNNSVQEECIDPDYNQESEDIEAMEELNEIQEVNEIVRFEEGPEKEADTSILNDQATSIVKLTDISIPKVTAKSFDLAKDSIAKSLSFQIKLGIKAKSLTTDLHTKREITEAVDEVMRDTEQKLQHVQSQYQLTVQDREQLLNETINTERIVTMIKEKSNGINKLYTDAFNRKESNKKVYLKTANRVSTILKTRRAALVEKRRRVHERLEEMKSVLNSKKERNDKIKVTELELTLENLRKENAALQSSREALNPAKRKLEFEIEELKQLICSSTTKFMENGAAYNNESSVNNELKSQIDELNMTLKLQENEEIGVRCDHLANTRTDLEKSSTRLEIDIGKAAEELFKIKEERQRNLQDYEATMKQIEENWQIKSTENENILRKIELEEQNLFKKQNQLKNIQESVKSSKKEYEELSNKHTVDSLLLNILTQNKENAYAEIASKELKIAALTGTFNDLMVVKTAQEEFERTKELIESEIVDLNQKLSNEKQEIDRRVKSSIESNEIKLTALHKNYEVERSALSALKDELYLLTAKKADTWATAEIVHQSYLSERNNFARAAKKTKEGTVASREVTNDVDAAEATWKLPQLRSTTRRGILKDSLTTNVFPDKKKVSFNVDDDVSSNPSFSPQTFVNKFLSK